VAKSKEKQKLEVLSNKPKQATLEKFNIKVQQSSETRNFPDLPDGTKLSIFSYNVNGLRASINKGAISDFIKKGKMKFLIIRKS